MDAIIEQVNSPADLKKLRKSDLPAYCEALRRYIMDVVPYTGGHLASSLGAVELAVALHYVYDSPTDKILWDVGHQAYAHKIITGRADRFGSLRQNGGISGFPRMSESEHDAFTMGHSSNSLSVALGYARARDLQEQKYDIVSVIGDGAFTGGMVFEALNDIGASQAKMVIVLNDNKMSISQNVGAVSKYLAYLRLSRRYVKVKRIVKKGVLGIPLFGNRIYRSLDRAKEGVKTVLQANKMFEQMGIKYYGPVDGHDVSGLIEIFRQVRNAKQPVLVHILTEKGKGYDAAQSDPSRFHGILPFGSEKEYAFGDIVSRFLCEHGDDPRLVAITAAMADGTGLHAFAERYPKRCFDVGIAEQHAVTLAAGLAAGGMKPYFAVYSTFLQRAYDQILHDVCLNDLPVTFLVDRAGAVGADGVTHQGIYDLGYLSMIPDMTVLAPKDGEELYDMLRWSLTFCHPLAIRYPKSYTLQKEHMLFSPGTWEILRDENADVVVLACGGRAVDAAMMCTGANIVNARSVKPLDTAMLRRLCAKGERIVTAEDNALRGGFGQSVVSYLNTLQAQTKVICLGYGDAFLDDYSVEHSLQTAGISVEGISRAIKILKDVHKKT